MPRYLAWDFDGTIAERPGMWSAAMSEAAAIEGFAVDASALKPHLQQGFPWHAPDRIRSAGETEDEWWRRLESLFESIFVNHLALNEARASLISRRVRSIYRDASRWKIFEDVRPVLDKLSNEGWRHVILSNHIPELDELVRDLGLRSCFEAIFSSGRTGVEKPHPAAFRLLREHAGPDSRIVMIGDSWDADIRGALSAGLEAILVRNHHPDFPCAYPGLRELHPWLARRGQSG